MRRKEKSIYWQISRESNFKNEKTLNVTLPTLYKN
jgi:hypothetical protein